VAEVYRTKGEPFGIVFDQRGELLLSLHYLVPIHGVADLFLVVSITQALSEALEQPRVLKAALPYLEPEEVEGQACPEDLVELMLLLKHIPGHENFLIHNVDAPSEINGLLQALSQEQVRHE